MTVNMNSCEDPPGNSDWVLVSEGDQKSSSLGLSDGAQNDSAKMSSNDHDDDDDDDFFQSLRMRQSENDQETEERKPSKNIVDSTPQVMFLETHHNHNDDVPDLILNISPTSISTDISEEKHNGSIDTKTKTTAKLTASTRKRRIALRLASTVIFLLIGDVWLAHRYRQNQKFKNSAFTADDLNENPSQDSEEAQTPVDIFPVDTFKQQYQDEWKQTQFDDRVENSVQPEIENHMTFLEEQNEKTEVQDHQQHEQSNIDSSPWEKLQEFDKQNITTEIVATDNLQLQQIFDDEQLEMELSPSPEQFSSSPDITLDDNFEKVVLQLNLLMQFASSTSQMTFDTSNKVYRFAIELAEQIASLTKDSAALLAKQLTQNTNDVMSELAATAYLANSMALQMMIELRRVTEQLANDSVAATGDFAQYLHSAAKSLKFQIRHQFSRIAKNVNQVMTKLASTNAEIQASSHTLAGGRESLMHVGTAAKSMMLQLDHQVHDIAQNVNHVTKELASTNTGIQKNTINMVGARESFTHIGNTLGKHTSRIFSRKLKIASLKI